MLLYIEICGFSGIFCSGVDVPVPEEFMSLSENNNAKRLGRANIVQMIGPV